MNIVSILKLKTVELNLQNKALEKLYSSCVYANTRYEMLKTNEQLANIKESKPYISVQFQGIAYVIFFCTIENTKYSLLISKKELKDTNSKNKSNEIKMFQMFVPYIDEKYYEGTVLDGKVIRNDNMKDLAFIVHGLYGKYFDELTFEQKLEIFKKDIYSKLNRNSPIQFTATKLYFHDQLPELLFQKVHQSNKKVIGLMFFSKTLSEPYYVYTDENEFMLLKENKPLPITKLYNNSMTEFLMKSSNTTDVYYLYDINDNTDVGLAHIPDIETSHYFAQIFKNEHTIKTKCLKSEKFNKWIPICDDCYDYNLDLLL